VTEGTITYAILLIVRFTAETVTRWLRRNKKSHLVALYTHTHTHTHIYINIYIYIHTYIFITAQTNLKD